MGTWQRSKSVQLLNVECHHVSGRRAFFPIHDFVTGRDQVVPSLFL